MLISPLHTKFYEANVSNGINRVQVVVGLSVSLTFPQPTHFFLSKWRGAKYITIRCELTGLVEGVWARLGDPKGDRYVRPSKPSSLTGCQSGWWNALAPLTLSHDLCSQERHSVKKHLFKQDGIKYRFKMVSKSFSPFLHISKIRNWWQGQVQMIF